MCWGTYYILLGFFFIITGLGCLLIHGGTENEHKYVWPSLIVIFLSCFCFAVWNGHVHGDYQMKQLEFEYYEAIVQKTRGSNKTEGDK